ncbi:ATP-binding protein [Burkholderia cenocepacia]|uniref:ATP-binding protein n=1 Tax=Burkholderia cenocepacia TaxID=95486 RepID=UPI002864FB21|nr:ATP-binding protein [Burkholderia cenocepacia]MDR8047991.1 response regulator [Burkholderia cenocepacia]
MIDQARRGLPRRIRQNQNLLLYGGGIVITLVVLAAFAVDCVSTVQVYLRQLTQQWVLEMRHVEQANSAYEAYFRSCQINVESAWNDGAKTRAQNVVAFAANGRVLALDNGAKAERMLIVGRANGALPVGLDRYVGVAERLAAMLATLRVGGGNALTNYIYSSANDLAILSLSTWPDPAVLQIRMTDRKQVVDALVHDRDGGPVLPPHWPTENPRTGHRALRWLPPYTNPITGERAVRVAGAVHDAAGRTVGIVVGEVPVALFLRGFPVKQVPGAIFIATQEGEVIASASDAPVTPDMLEKLRASRAFGMEHENERRYFSNGTIVLRERLNDTGWTLVYLQSWQQAARLIWPLMALKAATTVAIITVLWLVLLVFNRKMIKPALEQSQRVFDSEQLSRTLIETAPVGLGLISQNDGAPLLRSPTMDVLVSRVALDERALSSRFVQRQAGAPGAIVTPDELTLRAKDGSRIDLAVSMAPARYQGQPVIVTALTDVTAKNLLEERLRDAKRAADAASAAKSAFLATMSHEIRTPLNAILGNLELFAHTQLDARQQDRLGTIRRSSEGLLSIISDVLDFSKIEAGEIEFESLVFPVVDVLERSLGIFAPVARAKGVRLYPAFECDVAQTMRGDPTRIGQIVNNLLSNAVKFTAHGVVTLRASIDGGDLKVAVEDTGMGMTADQRAALFQPFAQADGSINRRFGGTGLGLALCHQLVNAMGGTIAVDSEPGKGSRFTMRVPLGEAVQMSAPLFANERKPLILVSSEPAWRAFASRHLKAWGLNLRAFAAPAEVPDELLDTACAVVLIGERDGWDAEDENRLVEAGTWVVTAGVDGPTRPVRVARMVDVTCYVLSALRDALRIALLADAIPAPAVVPVGPRKLSRALTVLVAEDNAVNRRLFEEQLAMLGCDVQVASDGEAALAALAQRPRDVLLTDLNMPGMDGFALAEQAHERYPDLPIVAVTAQVTLDERAKCAAAGIVAVATKPLSLTALADTLEAATGEAVASGENATDDSAVRGDGGNADGWLGGRALPADVLDVFRQTSAASLDVLHEAKRNGDAEALLAELHSLKGTLGVFRLRELALRCSDLELRVATGGAQALSDALLAAFDADVRASAVHGACAQKKRGCSDRATASTPHAEGRHRAR